MSEVFITRKKSNSYYYYLISYILLAVIVIFSIYIAYVSINNNNHYYLLLLIISIILFWIFSEIPKELLPSQVFFYKEEIIIKSYMPLIFWKKRIDKFNYQSINRIQLSLNSIRIYINSKSYTYNIIFNDNDRIEFIKLNPYELDNNFIDVKNI